MKYSIEGTEIDLSKSDVELIVYNACTLVAKYETTNDGLSLNERLLGEADDMAGVLNICGLDDLVEKTKRDLGLVYDDEEEDDEGYSDDEGDGVATCRIEYDLDYTGGDYGDVGDFVNIQPDKHEAVEHAFTRVTGHHRMHIIHYEWLEDEEDNSDDE